MKIDKIEKVGIISLCEHTWEYQERVDGFDWFICVKCGRNTKKVVNLSKLEAEFKLDQRNNSVQFGTVFENFQKGVKR